MSGNRAADVKGAKDVKMKMKRMMLAAVLVLFARPAFAQMTMQDVQAMSKWTEYQIVHYKIVGEYAGSTILLKGSGNTRIAEIHADVADRIEIEFDWNQQERKLVGKPVIRNFPTKLLPMPKSSACPAPKVDGSIEFVTGLDLTEGVTSTSGYLTLAIRRDQPGGTYPSYGDGSVCGEVWETAAPASIKSTLTVWAAPGTALVMATQMKLQLSPDKKSIVLPPESNPGATRYGWTWTITPTGVK